MQNGKYIVWEDEKKIAEFDNFQDAGAFLWKRAYRVCEGEYILREKKEKKKSYNKGYFFGALMVISVEIIINYFK